MFQLKNINLETDVDVYKTLLMTCHPNIEESTAVFTLPVSHRTFFRSFVRSFAAFVLSKFLLI